MVLVDTKSKSEVHNPHNGHYTSDTIHSKLTRVFTITFKYMYCNFERCFFLEAGSCDVKQFKNFINQRFLIFKLLYIFNIGSM